MALIDNLVSYWKLDETSGNRSDAHGSNTLTDHNGTSYLTGKIGNCADFEANSSNFLTISDNSDLSVGDIDFSFSFWMKFESLTFADYYAVSKGNEYQIYYDYANTKIRFRANTGGGASVYANNLGTPSIDTWYHVVCWHDSVNNVVGIVVNNGTADTVSYSSGFTDGSGTFAIGAYEWFSGFYTGYFDGVIDEVGFWKKVLSSSEISSLYNSGNGLAYPLSTTTLVNKSVNCLWNVYSNVNKTRQLIWNTNSLVNKQNQYIWNTKSLVYNTKQLVWNVNSLVSNVNQYIWDIKSLVSNTRQLVWNTNSLVNKQNQYIWNTKSLVYNTKQLVWNVNSLVNTSRQLEWDTYSLVSKQNQYVWDTLTLVNKQEELIWGINGLVNESCGLVWNTLANVSQQKQLVWNVNSLVSNVNQYIWDIKSLVSNTRQLVWNTKIVINRVSNLTCYLNQIDSRDLLIGKIDDKDLFLKINNIE